MARKVAGNGTSRASTTMTKQELEQWFETAPIMMREDLSLTENFFKYVGIPKAGWSYNNDGSIDVCTHLVLPGFMGAFPPIRLNKVNGTVRTSRTTPNLINCPKHITHDLICDDSDVVYTLEGVVRVDGCVFCTCLTSLKGVESTNADMTIGGVLTISSKCTHLVGLAYIEGVRRIQLMKGDQFITVKVIHDPFLWQEKLLDLGLVKQAQI